MPDNDRKQGQQKQTDPNRKDQPKKSGQDQTDRERERKRDEFRNER